MNIYVNIYYKYLNISIYISEHLIALTPGERRKAKGETRIKFKYLTFQKTKERVAIKKRTLTTKKKRVLSF